MSDKETVFYKRNLAVPFFTQRDNTYVWQQLYSFDAGIEQQQYNIIEELQVRMNENLDWNTIRLMEEESK